jgi:hypothetical protein
MGVLHRLLRAQNPDHIFRRKRSMNLRDFSPLGVREQEN